MTSGRKFLQPGSIYFFFFVFIFLLPFPGKPQSFQYNRTIKWEPSQMIRTSSADSMRLLMFTGVSRNEESFGYLPVFIERFPVPFTGDSLSHLVLENPVVRQLTLAETEGIRDLDRAGTGFITGKEYTVQKKKSFLNVFIVPVRKNAATGVYEELVSFRLRMEFVPSLAKNNKMSARTYASNSVLSQGSWMKLGIVSTGIYKITASDLKKVIPGIASVDPRNIRIFGNGGGMLPESNASSRIDDLREISIQVAGEEDGVLNDEDYVLFYGEGPDTWSYSKIDGKFHHKKNIYSDYSYYFLTYDNGPGKRIGIETSTTVPATNNVSTFDDYAFYEVDGINLIKSGKRWFDTQKFEVTTTRDYNFSFPDLDVLSPVKIMASVAARSTTVSTSFSVYVNNKTEKVMNIVVPATSSGFLDTFAKINSDTGSFLSSSSAFPVTLVYNQVTDAIGYLDYIELNAKRQIRMSGNQLGFRSAAATGTNKVTEFTLNSPGRSSAIWDVTDPGDISQVATTSEGDNEIFRLPTDSLKEFYAFDGGAFNTVQTAVRIGNQNLHGAESCDYLLITHPSFMDAANQLADFHRQHDNMKVLVTTPEIIYNEFSSGAQDLCGIRDFIKMFYDKAESGKEPKYVLLFGDGSYDYKNRLQNNTNFIPVYESEESLGPVNTFVTDDFIGLLDDNEGSGAAGTLDVGVGRLPVTTTDEAQAAVNKIVYYSTNSDAVKNDWRNLIAFVADDEDNNMHMTEAEDLTDIIDQSHNEYNVNKVYLDAYQQVSTPGGGRYPEVNDAINQQMAKGCLIMNYNGHGGTLGWSHERVLEIPDIKSWTNFDNMPLFLTATCEFSRFDDPSWVSAGEWVFLNASGGSIGLLTTTRPTYADGNIELASNFYEHAFNRTNGVFPKLGDLTLISKNLAAPSANTRKFVLLGDPGLTLAYPYENVVTTSINNHPVGTVPDTLMALASVTITGEVQDASGNRMTGFNGTVCSTVYDKESEIITLANDGGSPFDFMLRKNIIYKGKVEVTNGTFSFSFIVPKDIAYQYGFGRISYYAKSEDTDANGYYENVIVGGYSDGSVVDHNGPELRLFMNDTTFVSGGLTDQNPVMLAVIDDESGINTVGSGIGHDLVATLDNDSKNPIVLNDYYSTYLNTFHKGYISYPFFGLSDGWHTLSVKVWDVYNNSADASIEFLVVSSGETTVRNLMNYPNPFDGQTTFSFEFNHPDEEVDATILIYSYTGKLVKKIDQNIFVAGYRANTIKWDGTLDGGMKISSGNYVYQLVLKLADGGEARETSKMTVIP
jgi:hypothetical protein